ncbi:MAG: hypothetical protein JO001_13875 [Alphaproteobacteria bacterium]|nr:hypothetical protein [Alphaproteobacteria bacterium]
MTLPGSRTAHRGLALGVLGLLVLLLWAGPVSAYLGMIADGSEQLARRQALLQRYRALAEAPRPMATANGPPLLYPDIPETQATANLQETIKATASANGIQIHSMQMLLRGDIGGDGRRFGVRIRAGGDVASLGRLLYSIESARPLLYPDNLQIQAPLAASPSGNAAGNLEFQLDVSGFRGGAAS